MYIEHLYGKEQRVAVGHDTLFSMNT